MKIEANKNYEVEKYIYKADDVEVRNYGTISGADVAAMLKGYKYDEMFEMWYSGHANIGYAVQEVR